MVFHAFLNLALSVEVVLEPGAPLLGVAAPRPPELCSLWAPVEMFPHLLLGSWLQQWSSSSRTDALFATELCGSPRGMVACSSGPSPTPGIASAALQPSSGLRCEAGSIRELHRPRSLDPQSQVWLPSAAGRTRLAQPTPKTPKDSLSFVDLSISEKVCRPGVAELPSEGDDRGTGMGLVVDGSRWGAEMGLGEEERKSSLFRCVDLYPDSTQAGA